MPSKNVEPTETKWQTLGVLGMGMGRCWSKGMTFHLHILSTVMRVNSTELNTGIYCVEITSVFTAYNLGAP